MKIRNGNKILNVTEKAYRVVYKGLGYKVYKDGESDLLNEPTANENNDSSTIDIDDITKAEIVEILTEKGIDHNPRDKKEVLYNLMVRGD